LPGPLSWLGLVIAPVFGLKIWQSGTGSLACSGPAYDDLARCAVHPCLLPA